MPQVHLVGGRIATPLFSSLLVGVLSACAGGTTPPSPTAVVPTPAVVITQPTSIRATVQPTLTPIPTALPQATALPTQAPTAIPQVLTIETPPSGTLVGSPVVLTGRVAVVPASGKLGYRINNSAGQQIGGGDIAVAGSAGQPGSYTASLDFAPPSQGGDVQAQIFDRDPAGNPAATAALALFVAPPQAISFSSPAAGTFVGSPVVVTGNLARLPNQSNLAYIFFNSQGQPIGSGIFPVGGQPGRPTAFSASLGFELPLLGGDVQLQVYDQDGVSGATAGSATLLLKVVPQPQQLLFTSPSPNAFVNSPVVITGRTVRYPQQGSLGYRITDSAGTQLGAGAFPVTGAPGQGSTFNAQLSFNLPPQGGPVQIALFDQNVNTGVVVANAVLVLQTVPAQQSITITSPPPGTQVGSPVTITGRTARYPIGGQLSYRITNLSGNVLGGGSFAVAGPFGQPASFSASLTFSPPSTGGTVQVTILDSDPATSAIAASAALPLQVAPPAPVPQTITITSPPTGTLIGSPVVITGQATRLPAQGVFQYRVRGPNDQDLGRGIVPAIQIPGGSSFRVSIPFQTVPSGNTITVDIFELDPTTNSVVATASVQLQQLPIPR